MREAFAVHFCSAFFHKKYWRMLDIGICNFNEMFTNDIISFEQLGLDVYICLLTISCMFTVNIFMVSVTFLMFQN